MCFEDICEENETARLFFSAVLQKKAVQEKPLCSAQAAFRVSILLLPGIHIGRAESGTSLLQMSKRLFSAPAKAHMHLLIPSMAEVELLYALRAQKTASLEQMLSRVTDIAKGAALMTGTKVDDRMEPDR